MRFLAIAPILLCTASLVLTFLCLFAGSKPGFMSDYAILTLNTSRIGQNYFNHTKTYSNPFANFIANITHTIEDQIEDGITSAAHQLGLHDFYAWHILNFCEGYYTPTNLPNASFPLSAIHENITGCADRSALNSLRPGELLQTELDQAGHSNINVSQLGLPPHLDDGLSTVRMASEAMFVLYCLSIALIILSIVLSFACMFSNGRKLGLANFGVEWLATIALSSASSIATTVGVEGAHQMNTKMNKIGISAERGTKFLVLTWVAFALLFVAKTVWCVDEIARFRRIRKAKKLAKLEKVSLEEVHIMEKS